MKTISSRVSHIIYQYIAQPHCQLSSEPIIIRQAIKQGLYFHGLTMGKNNIIRPFTFEFYIVTIVER